jgi:DNA mismatch repair protein MutS
MNIDLKKENSLTLDYFRVLKEQEDKFGSNVALAAQCGSFMEFYEYDPDLDPNPKPGAQPIGKVREIAELLNMTQTSRDKDKPHSIQNTLMVGFPMLALDRHLPVLLAHDYTVILYHQVEQRPDKTWIRKITDIRSPATQLDVQPGHNTTNQIVALYLDAQKTRRQVRVAKDCEEIMIICGTSVFDVRTGKSIVGEAYSSENDPVAALQEAYRFLIAQSPREVLIHVENVEPTIQTLYEEFLRQILELERYPTVVIKFDRLVKDFLLVEYQKQFLEKIFSEKKSLQPTNGPKLVITQEKRQNSIIEDLNLERFFYGTISYITLLQYCYDHNEHLIERVEKPDTNWVNLETHLSLTHNTILQLNLLPGVGPDFRHTKFENRRDKGSRKKKFDSVLSVINEASTPMGRRFVRGMLLNPLVDSEEIERYYQMADEFLAQPDLFNSVLKLLTQIPDLELLQRKLSLLCIKPKEFAQLFRAYHRLTELFTLIHNSEATVLRSLLFGAEEGESFNQAMILAYTTFDLDRLEKAELNNGRIETTEFFLQNGVDQMADRFAQQIEQREAEIETIINHLNTILAGTRGKLLVFERPKKDPRKTKVDRGDKNERFDRNEREDDEEDDDTPAGMLGQPFIHTTSAKATVLKNKKLMVNANLCGKLVFQNYKSGRVIVTSEKISNICLDMEVARSSLMERLSTKYRSVVDQIAQGSRFFSAVTQFIKMVDHVATNVKVTLKYKYFRPRIDSRAEKSFVRVRNIRHPLVERLISTDYVVNDISLGERDDHHGYLIFGHNSSGKTTLTRAIGINLILAQMGFFTAGEMVYKPYTKIISRLTGNDDQLHGHSSYIVEMIEARTILRNTDAGTLVLGDELTRGTESLSGSALTIAMIEALIAKRSSFIFSTHMHHLPSTSFIKEIDPKLLRICHLTTIYDEKTQLLVFERLLREGQGKNTYGIEVAKSLNLPADFINRAEEIRRSLAGIPPMILDVKKSPYNKAMYVDSCFLCGETKGLETHHMEEQKKADQDGFINHQHKNREANLVVLCQGCHKKLHHEKKRIVTRTVANGNLLFEIVNE